MKKEKEIIKDIRMIIKKVGGSEREYEQIKNILLTFTNQKEKE